MASETAVQQNIRLALGKRPDVRLFRNNVGMAETSDGRVVRFGLCKGSSDLVGWKSVAVTPDMVGKRVAVFIALEVKAGKGRTTEAQRAFLDRVAVDGGIAGVARSVGEAEALLCR